MISFFPRVLVISILASLSMSIQAQTDQTDTTNLQSNTDSIPYMKLLQKEFTRITTGQSTNFGSYASYDVKNNTLILAGHVPLGDSSNLNFEVKGGIDEGIAPLFRGFKVNPNTSIKVQYNRNAYNNRIPIEANSTQMKNYRHSVDSLKTSLEEKEFEYEISLLNLKLEKKQKEREVLKCQKECARLEADSLPGMDIGIDSLNIRNERLLHDIQLLEMKIKKLDNDDEWARQMMNARREKYAAEKKLLNSLYLTGFKLRWLSFYGTVYSSSFYSFRDSLSFDEQVIKQQRLSWEIGSRYNFYTQENAQSNPNFYSIGISYLHYNNFNDLNKFTLIDKEEFGTAPLIRSVSSSKTVYVGEYVKNKSRIMLDFDMYLFFTKKSSIALHLNPQTSWHLDNISRSSLIIGCLFSLRDRKDSKSVINAEIFFQSDDLQVTFPDADFSCIHNGGIGLRFTFPIVFIKTR